jgi:integrase
MFHCFAWEEIRQEGFSVGSPQLSLFDPEGRIEPRADEGPSVPEAVDRYLDASGAAEGTRLSYRTTAKRWEEWSSCHRCLTPKGARAVTADDLRDFLRWVHEQAIAAGDGNPGRTANKRRTELRAVFRWLVEEAEELPAMPRFPKPVKQISVAGAYYFTDDEMSALYWATYSMRNRQWRDRDRSIGACWRAALVLFRSFGLDTHCLFRAVDRAKEVLCWKHVFPPGLPPGRCAKCECEHGWISWRRQKTGRLLILPLDEILAAHLRSIRPADADPQTPIFGSAGGAKPNIRFRGLIQRARIEPKFDLESGAAKPWVLKDLRKTCATVHGVELGRMVLGHASGSITEEHYANTVPEVLRAIRAMEHPEAFRSIVDQTIRPPGMLFPK